MPTAPADPSAVLDYLGFPLTADQVYADLLQAHEHSSALGQPLLTEAGVCYLEQHRSPTGESCSCPVAPRAPVYPLRGHDPLPVWEARSRRLWLGDRLLREFRHRAPNQITILQVFQEQDWTEAHIDDPLPIARGEHEEDRKRRLHETIKNLNRGMPPGTIRFRGDGTGEGVVWEYDR
jgi:hypothetical protein